MVFLFDPSFEISVAKLYIQNIGAATQVTANTAVNFESWA